VLMSASAHDPFHKGAKFFEIAHFWWSFYYLL